MALPYIKEVITKDYDLKENCKNGTDENRNIPRISKNILISLKNFLTMMWLCILIKKMKTNAQTSLEVLTEVLPILEKQADYSNDALYKALCEYVSEKGCKNGYVMWPIRTAVSGKQMTLGGATELMEVLGKEESLARIRKGIEKLSE